jgi:alpha-D-ribose 1-methylphosphonate 5-triphosphate diphosphatase
MELTFDGAQVLGPDGWEDRPLTLAGDRIAADRAGRTVDLRGFRLLPGLVDLHGDGFERHLAPRRGAVTDMALGLAALETELAASGITTAMLAQFWSWEGGMRGPDFAEGLATALAGFPAQLDLRLQLRLETGMSDSFDAADALIARAGIGYVVFNDHLPRAEVAAGKALPRLTGQALKAGRSPDAHAALIREMCARDHGPALAALAGRLAARGVLLGSHDDHRPEDRLRFRALGATVAEFPETVAAAKAARAGCDLIVMGAPNVLRGGSHAGKVAAEGLVAEGLCDVLVSDYHYPALLGAALKLADRYDWSRVWAMVSSAPAGALGLRDRGHLGAGARADVVVLNPATRRVEATFAAGRLVHATGAAAARLIG